MIVIIVIAGRKRMPTLLPLFAEKVLLGQLPYPRQEKPTWAIYSPKHAPTAASYNRDMLAHFSSL